AIAQQTAGDRILALRVKRRKLIARCKRNDAITLIEVEWIGGHEQCARPLLDCCREGALQLAVGTGFDGNQPFFFIKFCFGLRGEASGARKYGDFGIDRYELVEHFESFRDQVSRVEIDTS